MQKHCPRWSLRLLCNSQSVNSWLHCEYRANSKKIVLALRKKNEFIGK